MKPMIFEIKDKGFKESYATELDGTFLVNDTQEAATVRL
jgi:hypothetical protein